MPVHRNPPLGRSTHGWLRRHTAAVSVLAVSTSLLVGAEAAGGISILQTVTEGGSGTGASPRQLQEPKVVAPDDPLVEPGRDNPGHEKGHEPGVIGVPEGGSRPGLAGPPASSQQQQRADGGSTQAVGIGEAKSLPESGKQLSESAPAGKQLRVVEAAHRGYAVHCFGLQCVESKSGKVEEDPRRLGRTVVVGIVPAKLFESLMVDGAQPSQHKLLASLPSIMDSVQLGVSQIPQKVHDETQLSVSEWYLAARNYRPELALDDDAPLWSHASVTESTSEKDRPQLFDIAWLPTQRGPADENQEDADSEVMPPQSEAATQPGDTAKSEKDLFGGLLPPKEKQHSQSPQDKSPQGEPGQDECSAAAPESPPQQEAEPDSATQQLPEEPQKMRDEPPADTKQPDWQDPDAAEQPNGDSDAAAQQAAPPADAPESKDADPAAPSRSDADDPAESQLNVNDLLPG